MDRTLQAQCDDDQVCRLLLEADLGFRPLRKDKLEVHELEGGAVAFDPELDAIHRLDDRALFIWHACDGSSDVRQIARAVGPAWSLQQADALELTLHILRQLGIRELIVESHDRVTPGAENADSPSSDFRGHARRDVVRADTSRGSTDTGLSRRELVRGGVAKLVLAAPVISTFFAQAACATLPSAHGPDGNCKNVNFSCAANADCCDSGTENTACESNECCIRQNKDGCVVDGDCCAGLFCDAGGTCRP